jgi:isoleucyl-tRNA synthetase
VAGHTLEGDEFELALEAKEGVAATALRGNDAVVILDIEVTPELEAEGLARDLVRLVQNERRERGLDVTDRIALQLSAPASVREAIEPFEHYVAEQVLASSIEWTDAELATRGKVGDETVTFDFAVG